MRAPTPHLCRVVLFGLASSIASVWGTACVPGLSELPPPCVGGDCLPGATDQGEEPTDPTFSGAVCGDGVCDTTESGPVCPEDCASVCGDGFCQLGETAFSCAIDCAANCGDSFCEASESAITCPADCGTCGNGVCEPSETPPSCLADCPLSFDCSDYCALQAGCGYIGPDLVWPTVAACVVDCADRNDVSCLWCVATYDGGVAQCDADCDPNGCGFLCGTGELCGGVPGGSGDVGHEP